MSELIDRYATMDAIPAPTDADEAKYYGKICDAIEAIPTIEPEVRHGKGCEYCKGRSYTKRPLTVITRTMKRVEVCFNFCPKCGRDMRSTNTNGGKGGSENDT